MTKILIAGIDPGTVSAYCLLDLESNVIDLGSDRQITHSNLILNLTKHGKVYAIGSDVHPCPTLTTKIAGLIGAKIISPDHDLSYLEKIKIVDTYLKTKKDRIEINNKHEKDALAAALYGLKRINTLIKKIKDHLEEHNKKHLQDEVVKKVLLENIPISEAVRNLS